jgi:peptidoglycan hydrolase CwlO-like protein
MVFKSGRVRITITTTMIRSQNTESILINLDKKISSIQDTAAEEKRSREQYEREIERLKKEIKTSAAINMEEEKAKGRRPNNNGLYDDGETTSYNSSTIQYDSKEYIEESYRTARTRKR